MVDYSILWAQVNSRIGFLLDPILYMRYTDIPQSVQSDRLCYVISNMR